MAVKPFGDTTTTGTISNSIATDLADNNAGAISAQDVRQNLLDLTDSILPNVGSGDFLTVNPFVKNIKVKLHADPASRTNTGCVVLESGLIFDNDVADINQTQVVPYPGPTGINHSQLAGLTAGHPHTQYVNVSGGIFTGPVGFSGEYINSTSETLTGNDRGIKFHKIDSNEERIQVGSGTHFRFDLDSSKISSGKGVAKVWINFSASGTQQSHWDSTDYLTVNSSHNVSVLERVQEGGVAQRGKFKIHFPTGLFANSGDYVAIGTANARSSNAGPTDFEINTVGIVDRTATYVTFYVLASDGSYRDSEVNDLVLFGVESGVSTSSPTVRIGP